LDVRELSPGGIGRFQSRLTSCAAAVNSQVPNRTVYNYPTAPPQAHLGSNNNEAQRSHTNSPPSESSHRGYFHSANPLSRTQEQEAPGDHQYLLLCVNTKNSTTLLHINVSNFGNDQYLFEDISREYKNIRRKQEWKMSFLIPDWAETLFNKILALLPKHTSLSSWLYLPALSITFHEPQLYKVSSADFVRVYTQVFIIRLLLLIYLTVSTDPNR
jgi:hypothetical protein